ncbi:DNA cytosine methyltransferase, partial [Klebsiella pneumoniae]|nr:DNA cytosine methyltransferase [Klebsiella pneumoniae]EKT9088254.1 DNA cytosine methyltransferase [Klebsiella pneumoniae]EKU6738034.1 DNA cytosine methyltransferase [Klebsiella pneumoniae]EKU6749813.1 DNA cytosine methyltransferase [Klebsiella pneumoniae]EKU6761093.1 DNA cytosine methyltransferase [Klebsiella pneumoniae]
GWPDDRSVWTGSCPCQPFSAAGKGDGFADERHLWPHFFHLISERRPQHVFGEQVASGNANTWFDLVQADLEGMGYSFGLVPFASAGIGAPHIRERAYWVANATGQLHHQCNDGTNELGRKGNPEQNRMGGGIGGLGNANVARLERLGGNDGAAGRERATGPAAAPGLHLRPLEVNGFWRDADWLFCRDGKWRPVEPGTFPLVDGAAARLGRVEPGVARVASSNRVGRLKGYGNAINAQAAAAFIRAYMGVA